MLPRLQSEEKLDAINVAALGSGQVDRQYRMRAIGDLQRKALGTRFKPKKARARDLAGMGIGMRVASSSEAIGQKETPPASEGSVEGLNGPSAGAENPRSSSPKGGSGEKDHG